MALTDYKIPTRLVVGYRKTRNGMMYAYPTEIRLSKRTKKSAFKIENETSWKNKIDEKLPKKQIKNEPKDGFAIKHFHMEYRSASANRANFYIWHEEYGGHIFIQPDNLLELIKECSIDKGVIKEKLVYDGKNFVTEKTVEERLQLSNNSNDLFIKIKEESKDRKVIAKNLIPGNFYEVPPTKKDPVSKYYLIFLGRVTVEDGTTYFISKKVYKQYASQINKDIGEGSKIDICRYKSAALGELLVPGEIFGVHLVNDTNNNYRYSGRNHRNRKSFDYNGHTLRGSSYTSLSFTKTLPGQYTPTDDCMVGDKKINEMNFYNGYTSKELDLIDFLLLESIQTNHSSTIGVSSDATILARQALEVTEQTQVTKTKDINEPNE